MAVPTASYHAIFICPWPLLTTGDDAAICVASISLGGRRRGQRVVDEELDGVAELIRIGTPKALQRHSVPDEEEGRRPLDVVAISNFLYVEQGNTASMISSVRHDMMMGLNRNRMHACT